MNQHERLRFLITSLLQEIPRYTQQLQEGTLCIPEDEGEAFRLYRSLVNIRQPMPATDRYLAEEDAYLAQLAQEKGIVSLHDLGKAREEGIWLWQGDITRLAVDGIVNAANSQMLGCFVPCHGCIDNAIHTAAGIRLRLACNDVMRQKGKPEPTGMATVTPGFNLPAKHVVHTVGPIVQGFRPSARNKSDLESCYRMCLQMAVEYGMNSLAFCCISTGEFHYPHKEAAEVAVGVVRAARLEGNDVNVIFNVFKDEDYGIYDAILG